MIVGVQRKESGNKCCSTFCSEVIECSTERGQSLMMAGKRERRESSILKADVVTDVEVKE